MKGPVRPFHSISVCAIWLIVPAQVTRRADSNAASVARAPGSALHARGVGLELVVQRLRVDPAVSVRVRDHAPGRPPEQRHGAVRVPSQQVHVAGTHLREALEELGVVGAPRLLPCRLPRLVRREVAPSRACRRPSSWFSSRLSASKSSGIWSSFGRAPRLAGGRAGRADAPASAASGSGRRSCPGLPAACRHATPLDGLHARLRRSWNPSRHDHARPAHPLGSRVVRAVQRLLRAARGDDGHADRARRRRVPALPPGRADRDDRRLPRRCGPSARRTWSGSSARAALRRARGSRRWTSS